MTTTQVSVTSKDHTAVEVSVSMPVHIGLESSVRQGVPSVATAKQ